MRKMRVARAPRWIKIQRAVEVGKAVIVKHELRWERLTRNPLDASRRRVERMDGHAEASNHLQVPAHTVTDAERIDDAIGTQRRRPHGPAISPQARNLRQIEHLRVAESISPDHPL